MLFSFLRSLPAQFFCALCLTVWVIFPLVSATTVYFSFPSFLGILLRIIIPPYILLWARYLFYQLLTKSWFNFLADVLFSKFWFSLAHSLFMSSLTWDLKGHIREKCKSLRCQHSVIVTEETFQNCWTGNSIHLIVFTWVMLSTVTIKLNVHSLTRFSNAILSFSSIILRIRQ